MVQMLTIKPFKIGGYEIRPCEYGAYCAWVKEEKEMKETNLQHYKEELKKMFNENYKEPGNIIFEIRKKIDESIKSDRYYSHSTYTDDILEWMALPYKEPILYEVERKYLSAVIKPFRKKVKHIAIWDTCNGSKQFVHIKLYDEDCINLPNFKPNAMYKGMELHKEYTLEELGL